MSARVPPLDRARLGACVLLLIATLLLLRTPEQPPEAIPVATGRGCALGSRGSAPACACDEIPARLRRLLGLPIALNRASAEDLTLLRGIGPVRAQAIASDRKRSGEFSSVEDLARVAGIGPATVARLQGQLFTGHSDPACR